MNYTTIVKILCEDNMGRMAVKTEDDKLKKEFADQVASQFIKRVNRIASDRNLDSTKDFRKIMRIIQ